MNPINAKSVARRLLRPTVPFHFEGTMHKPSHFPSPDNAYDGATYWQTVNFRGRPLGLRLSEGSSAEIDLEIFSQRPLSVVDIEAVETELRWRFDLDTDLRPFTDLLQHDSTLSAVLEKWRGMRVSCAYSLYEFLIVTIVLQNTTVRRSVQMLDALFHAYGRRMRYGGRELWVFWSPQDLVHVTEDELRALKLGYRARFIRRITEQFAKGAIDELALRNCTKEAAGRELLSLYGIGPASVGMLLFEVFHHCDAFDRISPWEQKILSRLLFAKDDVPAERILKLARRRWKSWRMLAVHYLFEDLFWKHLGQPVDWLIPLIRL